MRKASVVFTVAVPTIAVAALVIAGLDVRPLRAGDHFDSPSVLKDGRTDIGDVYIFPAQKKKRETTLIMTVAPLAGLLSPAEFNDEAHYIFNFDNDGDFKVDRQWSVAFDGDNMQVSLDGVEMGSGSYGRRPIRLDGGGRANAGMFDDPFYFDLLAAQNGLAFCPGGVGFDFFSNANVMAIILDIPNGSVGLDVLPGVNFWGSVQTGNKQIDRMGRPFINLFLVGPLKKNQNAFNKNKRPHNDPKRFGTVVNNNVMALGADEATAAVLVAALLPDVMQYSRQAESMFPNGRGLADDVANITLAMLTSNPAATDCVDGNDGEFSKKFPYLAAAH